MTDLMTYTEAAALLQVRPGTLMAWVHRRQIPHRRLSGRTVRFSRDELRAWLDARAVADIHDVPSRL